jgi:hypothetical protein
MLADPITVAASSPNPEIKLAIVNQDAYGTERRDTNNGGYSTKINHAKLKDGDRHYLQLLLDKDVTDPYTSLVRRKQMSASISFTVPQGFTPTEAENLVKALVDTLNDSEVTSAKLLQWQS